MKLGFQAWWLSHQFDRFFRIYFKYFNTKRVESHAKFIPIKDSIFHVSNHFDSFLWNYFYEIVSVYFWVGS